jgi:cell division protein FtsW
MGENSVFGKLKGDRSIWLIVLFLVMISIAAVYSSSSTLAHRSNKPVYDILYGHLKYVLLGFTALYVASRIPLKFYRKLIAAGLVICIVTLALTPFIGKTVNGADRWINIFGFDFQPAEAAKVALILYIAKIFEISKLETFRQFMWLVLFPVGLTVVLILIGSVSAAALLTFTVLLLFIIAGVKWGYIFKSGLIGLATLAVIVGLYFSFGYFPRVGTGIKRIERFIDKKDPDLKQLTPQEIQEKADKTYQEKMAKLAISGVGVLGKGPGNSTQRYLLPHPYSDFIFAIIVEEWGLIGGILVIMLYLVFLFRSIQLARKCQHTFTMMTVIGLALLITTQAFLHISVNVGIWPVTGQTLPLISLGGSSYLFMSISFGIILAVSRYIEKQNEIEEKNKTEEEYGKEI